MNNEMSQQAAVGSAADPNTGHEVAIVGMAGRFPGAPDLDGFWAALLGGRRAGRAFTPAELRAAGIRDDQAAHQYWVAHGIELEGVEEFDAEFFHITGAEARLMDPQHRLFLECAWAALEDAGTPPTEHGGRIGVFGSTTFSSYLTEHVLRSPDHRDDLFAHPVIVGNDKDFLCSRVSYKLDLRGPSLTVQSACSSSLTALHLAATSLLGRECDVALAGGVSITLPQTGGYLYREGGILSRDGVCRPFDAGATGTVKGNGCGMIVLKRLSTALADRDHIYAVVRGTAVNNDGAAKVGYTAPSADGQAEVVLDALAFSGVDADDIDYVETHGTGTYLGDPIEVRALAAAYSARNTDMPCRLGSLKANFGHLDAAAGVAGVIKAALVLDRQIVPPQINVEQLNPQLQLGTTPFTVYRGAPLPARLRAAAVSSFGIGGSNAHCVLSAAAPDDRPVPPRGEYLVVISARDHPALTELEFRLADRLVRAPAPRLDDVAYTLLSGRVQASVRRAFRVHTIGELAEALRTDASGTAHPAVTDDSTEASAGAAVLRHARRTSLPGHPLRRTRHWVDRVAGPTQNENRTAAVPAPSATADRFVPIDAEEVLAVMAAAIGTPDMGLDDDHSTSGGDSLAAVEIVSALRDRTGVVLGLGEFQELGTARRVAARMAQPQLDPERIVTRLSPPRATEAGDVFLVHPAGGTTFCYVELARHSALPGTLHAVSFPFSRAADLRSVRDVARCYVEEVRRVQPTGPYRLGGYSFGGNVAFEMALQLQAVGERVEQLVMFDAHPPESYLGQQVGERDFLAAFPLLLEAMFDVGVDALPVVVPESLSEALEMARQPSWSDRTLEEYRRFFTVWRTNHDALKAWYPDASFDGHLTVLAAEQPESARILDQLRIVYHDRATWQRHVTGRTDVIPVPGNHYTMLDPVHAPRLAATFDNVLHESPFLVTGRAGVR